MSIKLKEVAFLKTTAEPVYVMQFHEPTDMVSVRRPLNSRDGITHVVDQFSIDELENEADALARDVQRKITMYKLQQDLIQPEATTEISAVRN